MEPLRIFIIEDDELFSKTLEYHLAQNPDNEIIKFKSGKDAISNLINNPSVILLDYNLPDMTGLDVFKTIKKTDPDLPVIIVSGQKDVSTAVEFFKLGVYDYMVKNDNIKARVWNAVNKIRQTSELKSEIVHLRKEVTEKYDINKSLIGNSPQIEKINRLLSKAADSDITVSLTGETGTGKELAATVIHYNSSRSKGPLVAINVSAIPHDLIESEMFGHEKGAFTGATSRRTGKFEEAHNGTLFLDEIAEMDLNMQVKLLRVLQERELFRVGGNTKIKIDTRVIIASNKDLAEEVSKGNFREDLYYRLLGLPIELPPLRERGNDVLILAQHFINQNCKNSKIKACKLSQEAQKKLLSYDYPGNVRELKSIIDLAVVMANGEIIEDTDISFHASRQRPNYSLQENTLRGHTLNIITNYLEKYNNDIPLVAKKLDIGKSTIYRILKEEIKKAE